MKTTLSAMTAPDLASTQTAYPAGSSSFGAGFRAYLESCETVEEKMESPISQQPTDCLGSTEMLSGSNDAWQTFTDKVRERLCGSLGNALLLAMQPTTKARTLSQAITALRSA